MKFVDVNLSSCVLTPAPAVYCGVITFSAVLGSNKLLGVRTQLDKFTSTNFTGAPATLTLYKVQFGGAAGNSNLVRIKTLAAGECYTWPEIVGHVLNTGDFIATNAGAAASVNIMASGRENT